MNPATIHAPRASKRPPLSDLSIRASLQLDARKRILVRQELFDLVVEFDDLRRRWEHIVMEGRS